MDITKQGFRDLINVEREYQLKKWGEQKHSDEKWLAILTEEVGEVAKAILENDDVELDGLGDPTPTEMCQVAAVLESWVTSRDFFQKNGKQ